VRSKLLHRLGPEAADAIDEFADIALTYDDGAPPSLTGFLAALRQGGRDVKRDMEHGRNEVRVMTVHGAKGLEAPIVFLPDTCTTASGEGGMRLMKLAEADRPVDVPPPVVWPVKGTSRLSAIRDAAHFKNAREGEERNRLLYVALTRARDRLYVSGFENRRGRSEGCWYDLISEALKDAVTATQAFDGGPARRVEAPQRDTPDEKDKTALEAQRSEPLPSFALKRAAPEQQLSIPLAPSRLEPYAPDAEGEPILPPRREEVSPQDRPAPRALKADNRFLRGTITHALLQHLPEIPVAKRAETAKAFVEKSGKELKPGQRASIVSETLAVLVTGSFAALFSETSRAEVPLAAMIPRPGGKGPALKLSGQIDRLAVTADEVLIVDYKTNRPPPREVVKVAPAYLFQLAAYVLALSDIYPDKRIRCALLWTDGPNLMEIPEPLIAQYITRLWDLDPASLGPAGG
jgi:ATP-dependent helicase/nuclease subunit A